METLATQTTRSQEGLNLKKRKQETFPILPPTPRQFSLEIRATSKWVASVWKPNTRVSHHEEGKKAELTTASQFFSLFVKLFLSPYPPLRSTFLKGWTKQREVAQYPAAPFAFYRTRIYWNRLKLTRHTHIYLWFMTEHLGLNNRSWKLVQVAENTRIVSKSVLIAGIDFLNFQSSFALLFLMSAESHFFLL